MRSANIVIAIFLVALAGYYGRSAMNGLRSGQIVVPSGSTRYRSRNSDRRGFWLSLSAYAALALFAAVAAVELLGFLWR